MEETRSEVGLKGQILYPPPKFNFDSFVFDIEHARGGKHPHDVSKEEARRFIQEAYFVIYAIKAVIIITAKIAGYLYNLATKKNTYGV